MELPPSNRPLGHIYIGIADGVPGAHENGHIVMAYIVMADGVPGAHEIGRADTSLGRLDGNLPTVSWAMPNGWLIP